MQEFRRLLPLVFVFCMATPAVSETVTLQNGGDFFVAGPAVTEAVDTAGDTFIAARTANARGASQGDLHVIGVDVSIGADAAADLYAIGGTVAVRGAVAEDLTAAGVSVRTERTSETQGNARLIGNSVTIEGPIGGALTATGTDVILNAPIAGDVRIVAGTVSFGPDAKIGGALFYSAEQELAVPERVIPPERVRFEQISMIDAWDEFRDLRRDMPVLPTFMTMFFGFIISLLFFLVLGALMLGFMPKRLEAMRLGISDGPGKSILLGVVGLSMLFGMVPITALTIIGLPFVPIALLAIVVAWTFGYALGAYSVAMRVWIGLDGDPDPSNMARLMVFAAAIIFVALLNFIPFVGWVANYTLVLLGIGAMTNSLFLHLIGNPGAAFDVDMKPIED